MKSHKRVIFAILASCIAGVACAALFFTVWTNGIGTNSKAKAEAIIASCKDKDETRTHCYEREVPALYGTVALKDIFEVIRQIRVGDPEYQFCHPLAHKLGELRVAEDPTNWIDAIALNPADGLCSNGYIHGVIVGRFRNEELDASQMTAVMPEFKRACEPRSDWQATSLDQAICYHGMGHLFMFVTEASYRRSLDACAEIGASPTGDFMRVCREGVFMQTYQPLEPDDFALIDLLPRKPTKENYRSICAVFASPDERGACLREAWPLFRKELFDGTGIDSFCAGHPNKAMQDACYQTVFTIVGRQTQDLHSHATVAKACGAVSTDRQPLCYGAVARAYIEEERTAGEQATDVCFSAPEGAVRKGCFEDLTGSLEFIFGPGSPDARRLCLLVPPEYRSQCVRQGVADEDTGS